MGHYFLDIQYTDRCQFWCLRFLSCVHTCAEPPADINTMTAVLTFKLHDLAEKCICSKIIRLWMCGPGYLYKMVAKIMLRCVK